MKRTAVEHFEQRALESVARVLMRHLLVPRIYFGAHWPAEGSEERDVVAVDRSGTGDVHVVEVKASWRRALAQANLNRLIQVPANFLWIAFPKPSHYVSYDDESVYVSDGAGRIGVIEVVQMQDETLGANIVLQAERFHVRLDEQVRRFVERTKSDISFR